MRGRTSWDGSCRRRCRRSWGPGRASSSRATGVRRSSSRWRSNAADARATLRSQSTATMTRPENAIAVCPGSYDPITNGHLDVIRRAANLYDEVVVAVVNRSVRKSSALFGIEERVGFIERALDDLETVRVEPFPTLVVDFARSLGARAIVKGLRAIS